MSRYTYKFLFIFFIINFLSFSYAEDRVAFIDIDFILSQSNASKSLLKQLNNIESINNKDFQSKEKKFKNQENRILSSKNILSKDEYNKKVNIFKND